MTGDRLTVLAHHEVPDGPVDAALHALTTTDQLASVSSSICDLASAAFGVCLRKAKQSRVLAEAPRRKNERFTPLLMLDQESAAGVAQRFVATARAVAEPAAGDTGGLADFAYAMLADAVGLTRVYLGGLSNRRARAWLASQADQRGGSSEPEHSVRVIVRAARHKIEQTPNRPGDGPVPMGESRFDTTGDAGL